MSTMKHLFDLAWSCLDLCTMHLRSHCTSPGSFLPKENYLNLNNISFHVAFYCYPTVRTTRFFLYQPDVYLVVNFLSQIVFIVPYCFCEW